MKKNKKTVFSLVATAVLIGFGVFTIENSAQAVSGADSWEPSGVKSAQYQMSGASFLPWTDLDVKEVTSLTGFDVMVTQPGITYLTVTSEDNAGNTSMEMKVVVVGDDETSVSPVRSIQYTLSGATTKGWTAYSEPFKISNEGITTLQVQIVDEAGNVGNVTRLIKLDKSAPINNGVTITLN